MAAERPTIPVNPIELTCSALDCLSDDPVIASECMTLAVKYVIDEPMPELRCINTTELFVAEYAVLVQLQPVGVRRDIERVPWIRLE